MTKNVKPSMFHSSAGTCVSQHGSSLTTKAVTRLSHGNTETHGSCCLGNGYDRIQYMEDDDKYK